MGYDIVKVIFLELKKPNHSFRRRTEEVTYEVKDLTIDWT